MKKRRMALAIVVVGSVVLGMLAVDARAAAPPGHFTDLGDGTVRDNMTGLVWQQGFSASIQDQAASIAYCSTLAVPRGVGWRLPTVLELRSIVDETVFAPAIDLAYFPRTPAEEFWSASSVVSSPSNGWFVNFNYGMAIGYLGAAGNGRARCVR